MQPIDSLDGHAGRSVLFFTIAAGLLTGCSAPATQVAATRGISEPPPIEKKRSSEDRIRDLEEDVKKLWWELRCKNDKVRDFVRDCDKQIVSGGATSQCATENLEPMIQRMFDVPHVLVRLWARDLGPPAHGKRGPAQPHSNIHPDGQLRIGGLRVAQMDERFGQEKMASTSTVYIVYQPSSDNPVHTEEAAKLARMLVHDHLVGRLHAHERSLRTPLPISCRNKAELLKRYSHLPQDQPKPDEPQASEPQHSIWMFRVDCPPPAEEKAERRP